MIEKFFNVTRGACECKTDFDENTGTYCYVSDDVTMNVEGLYPGTVTVDRTCVILDKDKLVGCGGLSSCDMTAECDDMVSDAIQAGYGNATIVPFVNQTDCDAIDCFAVSNREDPFAVYKMNMLCNLLKSAGYIQPLAAVEERLEIVGIVFGAIAAVCCLLCCSSCCARSRCCRSTTEEVVRVEHPYTEITVEAPRRRIGMLEP